MTKHIRPTWAKPMPPWVKVGSIVATALVIVLSAYALYQKGADHSMPPSLGTGNNASPILPDTTDNIHLAQIGNYHISDPTSEVGKVNIVWNARPNTQVPGVVNLYYLLLNGDAAPGLSAYDLNWFLSTDPNKSYVYNGTRYKLSQIHPTWKTWTWILYQCDQKTPAYIIGTPNIPLDYANPDVEQFLREQYIQPAFAHGADGIALDDVFAVNEQKACGTFTAAHTWQTIIYSPWIIRAVQAFTGTIHATNAHAFIAMNSPIDNVYPPSQVQEFLPFTDIHVDERGFTTTDSPYTVGGYITGQSWLAKVQQYTDEINAGKALIIVDLESVAPPSLSRAKLAWDLANYLLVKGDHTYLSIDGTSYGYLYDRPEYHIQIGYPIGAMHYYLGPSEELETRTFSAGKVWVNFSAGKSYSFPLKHAYQDMYGQMYAAGTQVTLPPHSALILLQAP